MGADPWMIKSGLHYYYCKSGAGGISVSRSDDPTAPGKLVKVWVAPEGQWNATCIWAPELHHIGKKWYIYYAGGKSGPPFVYQRSGVLESVTDDPQGKYIDRGMLHTGSDPADYSTTVWAIDLTVSEINGKLYAVWSGWDVNAKTDKTKQNLYIASMSDPVTISSERVKISSPTEKWETGGPLDLNEGPQFLKHGKKIHIIYSTRESWLPAYRLAQLTLQDSMTNPLDPANWTKRGPVFQGTKKVIGVGHASFIPSPDGKESWIVYHSKIDSVPGWKRNVRMQPFTFDKDDNPVFGDPVPAGVALKKPSGSGHKH